MSITNIGSADSLSETSGQVFLAPDDSNASWQPVGINYPVTIGDNVWVGDDGRAEIDFGAGHVRLARETNVHFAQLDDRQFSAYLASGQAILRLRALEPGETAKFDTANAQIMSCAPAAMDHTDGDGLYASVVVTRSRTPRGGSDGAGDRRAVCGRGGTARRDLSS
jgi:hypothetical protein